MTSLASLLLGISGSIAARVLTTLGIGMVSYASLTALAEKLKGLVLQNFNALDPGILGLIELSGFGEYINIVIAAFIAKAGFMALKKLAPIPD